MRHHADAPALLLALTLLGGCATLAPAKPPDLAGRLALRVAAHGTSALRSVSSGFELRGDATSGELLLTTALGSIAAQARWRPGAVELSTGQDTHRFADLDSLAQELLGEALPLAALIDWLRGRPWHGAPSQAVAGGFEQLGWHIDLGRFVEGWVVAERKRAPAITLRALLERSE